MKSRFIIDGLNRKNAKIIRDSIYFLKYVNEVRVDLEGSVIIVLSSKNVEESVKGIVNMTGARFRTKIE